MISSDDLHVATVQALIRGTLPSATTQPAQTIGVMTLKYEVRQLIDVRQRLGIGGEAAGATPQAGTNLPSYLVTCTQRVTLPNQSPFNLTGTDLSKSDSWFPLASGYVGYPVLLKTSMTPAIADLQNANFGLRLVEYSPKTVNASVGRSTSQGTGKSTGATREHSTGSSTSDTNTYGMSVTAGFFGKDLTGGIEGSYSHSTTDSSSSSDSTGRSSGASHDVTVGSNMSIKDWAAFSQLASPDGSALPTALTWIWGQEYPWDAIQFLPQPDGDTSPGGFVVALPDSMQDALFDLVYTEGTTVSPLSHVYPPSHLSLFGVDFTMKATWLADLPADLDGKLELAHDVDYAQGAHGLAPPDDGSTPTVYQKPISDAGLVSLDLSPFVSPTLDLTLLGLDPVIGGASDNGAVIGFFAPDKFVVPPTGETGSFKILSDGNTLQATGNGFDTAMTSSFTRGQTDVGLDFKIIDTTVSYSLFLKHWKTSATGCTLSIVVNESTTLTRHVDSMEGEGGDDNLLSISLRNLNYASINYHDYLRLGHNTIAITITPDDPTSGGGYALRTVAIGED